MFESVRKIIGATIPWPQRYAIESWVAKQQGNTAGTLVHVYKEQPCCVPREGESHPHSDGAYFFFAGKLGFGFARFA
jgi:hypothetical protein